MNYQEKYIVRHMAVRKIPTNYIWCCNGVEWVKDAWENVLKLNRTTPLANLCSECFEAVCLWHDANRPSLMAFFDTWAAEGYPSAEEEENNVSNL